MRKVSGKISKTMAFNLIFVALLVLEVVLGYVGYDSFVPDPLVAGPIATLVLAGVNIILRRLTEEPMA